MPVAQQPAIHVKLIFEKYFSLKCFSKNISHKLLTGYVTMYMDDMCWLGNWGMVKTMRSYLDIAYLDKDKEGLRKDLDSQLQVHSDSDAHLQGCQW